MNEHRTPPTRWIIHLNYVDCLTLSGVLSSAIAIALALEQQFLWSIAILFIAMLVDALDGILARRLRLERPFGRYLDGFMDLLIYLVTPALIVYGWQLGPASYISSLLLLACGCIRLSVFNDIGNIETSAGRAYLGMPVFWSVMLLAIAQLLMLVHNAVAVVFVPVAFGLFSLAMLWHRPFFKFKRLGHIVGITLGGFILFAILAIRLSP